MIFWLMLGFNLQGTINTIQLSHPGTWHAWAKAMHADYVAIGYGDIEHGPELEFRDTAPKNWTVISKGDDQGWLFAPYGKHFYLELRSHRVK